MFIAMNRFKIKPGEEEAFERMWLDREVFIHKTPGFREFHLLRGPKTDEYTLYSSHTVWESKEHFEAWTRSEEFRAAHKDAGNSKPTYIGHPEFEGFEVLQTVEPAEPA